MGIESIVESIEKLVHERTKSVKSNQKMIYVLKKLDIPTLFDPDPDPDPQEILKAIQKYVDSQNSALYPFKIPIIVDTSKIPKRLKYLLHIQYIQQRHHNLMMQLYELCVKTEKQKNTIKNLVMKDVDVDVDDIFFKYPEYDAMQQSLVQYYNLKTIDNQILIWKRIKLISGYCRSTLIPHEMTQLIFNFFF